jgi:TPR repeat protein
MRDGWRDEYYSLCVAGEHEEAVALVRQAVAEGSMSAQVMLAKMYHRTGMSADEADELIDYVERNMDPSDVEVHLELSIAYGLYMGRCPPQEKPARRFSHLLKAAELGAGAPYSLEVARGYRWGINSVEVNEAEATRWYKRAIEQGSVEAAQELQDHYELVENNVSIARYRQALLKRGSVSALVRVALHARAMGMTRSEARELIDMAEDAIDPTDIEAHLTLSEAYERGVARGAAKERNVLRLDHLLKAAELGAGAKVSLALARLYRDGAPGVPINREEAMRWFARAAKEENETAILELGDLRENGTIVPLRWPRKAK